MRAALPSLVAAALALAACNESADTLPAPPTDAGGIADGSTANDDGGATAADTGVATGGDTGVATGGDSGTGSQDAAPIGGDAGVSPITDICDPVDQTGCAAPESKCVIESQTARGGTRCVTPMAGDKALNAQCVGADCQPGLVCVRTATAAISQCRKACDPRDGTGCEMLGMDFDCRPTLRDTNWAICSYIGAPCNAYTQAPCGPTETCLPIRRANQHFELHCRAAGPVGLGGACGDTTTTRCMRGLVCVSSGGAQGSCRKICETGNDCAMGSMCTGRVTDVDLMYCSP